MVAFKVPEEEVLVGWGIFQAWVLFFLISCWRLGPPTVQAGLKSAGCAPLPREAWQGSPVPGENGGLLLSAWNLWVPPP